MDGWADKWTNAIAQIKRGFSSSVPQCILQIHSNTWRSAIEAGTAKPMQPTCNQYCKYTAHALQFDLGGCIISLLLQCCVVNKNLSNTFLPRSVLSTPQTSL